MDHEHGTEVCPAIVSVVGQVGSTISTEPTTADALRESQFRGWHKHSSCNNTLLS